MAINVDTVYKTVLLILNKEQRGYMTPDEFNKIATQVQLETFENYFESLNQQLRVPDNDSEYADRIKNIEEKISIFKKYAATTYSVDHFTLPADLYRLGTVVYKDETEAQLIQRNDLLYVNQSPLTKPTDKYPLYLYEDNKLYLKPASINSNISVSYVKKPADVIWNFTIPQFQNYYQFDAANSTNFELDVSEQPEEIGRQHDVLYVGPGYLPPPDDVAPGWQDEGPYDVPGLVNDHGPFDCIITYGLKYSWQFHGLDKVGAECEDAYKVHFACDLVPAIPGYQGTIDPYMKFLDRDNYHAIFALSAGVVTTLLHRGRATEEGKDVFFLPFGVDTDVYVPGEEDWDKRIWDVMTSYSVHDAIYPMRQKLINATNELPVKHHDRRVFGDTFVNTLGKAKIGVNASSAYMRWNMKPLEVMACGALCFTDRVEEFKERLNFKDGKHLIIYENVNDYKEKVMYYLENPKKAQKIAISGMNYARRYHSNKVRVEQMTKCLDTMI